MRRTKGHRSFSRWKRETKKNNGQIAALIGVSSSQVSRLDTTAAQPGLAQVLILQTVAKIPITDWLTVAEYRFVVEQLSTPGAA